MDSVVHIIDNSDVDLPARASDTHKTDYGRILIVGGCVGYAGAVKMAALSALRSGAGLVYLAVPESIYVPVAASMTEAMVLPYPADSEAGCFHKNSIDRILDRASSCDVLILGPGMGRSEGCELLTERLLQSFRGTVVLDADGLYALSQIQKKKQITVSGRVIVTPHHGEFMRLTGQISVSDPVNEAASYSETTGFITVLKGPETVIAFPNGKTMLSRKGNPGMATGGSGDVLAGLIGGFAGQFSPEQAVINGVYIHGSAGDMAAEELSEYSMLPTDMISRIPLIIKQLATKKREGKNHE